MQCGKYTYSSLCRYTVHDYHHHTHTLSLSLRTFTAAPALLRPPSPVAPVVCCPVACRPPARCLPLLLSTAAAACWHDHGASCRALLSPPPGALFSFDGCVLLCPCLSVEAEATHLGLHMFALPKSCSCSETWTRAPATTPTAQEARGGRAMRADVRLALLEVPPPQTVLRLALAPPCHAPRGSRTRGAASLRVASPK